MIDTWDNKVCLVLTFPCRVKANELESYLQRSYSVKKPLIIIFILLVATPLLFGFTQKRTPQLSAKLPPPPNLDLQENVQLDLSILGAPIATKEQCLAYLLKKNPYPLLSIPPGKLVDMYYEAGLTEGVRPDVAFAQSLHETGYFKYGGDVSPFQNNFAGIGATGNKARGASFALPLTGIYAQMQHLRGYATSLPPAAPLVDPRYDVLKTTPYFGKATTWISLNGKWAVPGNTYGQMILAIHEKIVEQR